MRRFGCLVLAMTFLAGIVGCGDDSSDSGDDAGASASTTTEETTTTETTATTESTMTSTTTTSTTTTAAPPAEPGVVRGVVVASSGQIRGGELTWSLEVKLPGGETVTVEAPVVAEAGAQVEVEQTPGGDWVYVGYVG